MSAAGGAALVDYDAVKVVYLIGDTRQRNFSIDCLVHVGFSVKRQWIPNPILNLAPERVEPFYRENQDSGCLVYRCPFCRVLLGVAFRAKVLIAFREVVNRAEFLQCLPQSGIPGFCVELDRKREGFVKCI